MRWPTAHAYLSCRLDPVEGFSRVVPATEPPLCCGKLHRVSPPNRAGANVVGPCIPPPQLGMHVVDSKHACSRVHVTPIDGHN